MLPGEKPASLFPFGWQIVSLMGWSRGKGEKGGFGVVVFGINAGEYIRLASNLLNSGIFWHKELIRIAAGRTKSRITAHFFSDFG